MRTFTVIALCLLISACSSNSGANSQSASSPSESSPSASQAEATATPQVQTTAAPAVAVLKDSTVTFQAAQAACAGALGSVTFSLGHARAHAAPGVELQENLASAGFVTMVFTDKTAGKTSTIEVNGHNRSITGAGVMTKRNGAVGCVMAQ